MEKSLRTIQKLSKLGRILSRIILIFCIVGAAFCLIGLTGWGGSTLVRFADVKINGVVPESAGAALAAFRASMAGGLVSLVFEILLAGSAARYFRSELADGTPFTLRGADEMKRLGIRAIVLPLLGSLGSELVSYLVAKNLGIDLKPELHASVSLTMGILFLVESVIFRYGAQREQAASEKDA